MNAQCAGLPSRTDWTSMIPPRGCLHQVSAREEELEDKEDEEKNKRDEVRT